MNGSASLVDDAARGGWELFAYMQLQFQELDVQFQELDLLPRVT